jgi:hypothetical protein
MWEACRLRGGGFGTGRPVVMKDSKRVSTIDYEPQYKRKYQRAIYSHPSNLQLGFELWVVAPRMV